MMQIVTVNLPSIYVDAIGKLVDERLFPSRSEAIRAALRDFLKSELGMVESLLDLNDSGPAVIPQPQPVQKKLDMRSCKAGWASTGKGRGAQPVNEPPRKPFGQPAKATAGPIARAVQAVPNISDTSIARIKKQLGMRG